MIVEIRSPEPSAAVFLGFRDEVDPATLAEWVRRGSTMLVPFVGGDCRLVGTVEAVRSMPPDPEATDAAAPSFG